MIRSVVRLASVMFLAVLVFSGTGNTQPPSGGPGGPPAGQGGGAPFGGGPLAIAHVIYTDNPPHDSLVTDSENIVNFTYLPDISVVCLQVNFTPKYLMVTSPAQASAIFANGGLFYSIKRNGTWVGYDDGQGIGGSQCDSVAGANVWLAETGAEYLALIY